MMKKVSFAEAAKSCAIMFCVCFTMIVAPASIICLLLDGSSGEALEYIGVIRIVVLCAVLAVLKTLMVTLEKTALKSWPYMSIRLLCYPIFLAVTLIFTLPFMGGNVLAVVVIFTVTFVICSVIAVLVHRSRAEDYTEKLNRYIDENTEESKNE